MKKFLEKFIIFFIVTLSITLFATEESGVPNEVIKDNPKREVKTVESMKVRDKATMSLSITKVTPEEIMGVLRDGKLSVYIEKNTKQPKNKMNKIDVSKLKLKAYSNPKLQRTPIKNMRGIKPEFTEEDIKNLMRYDNKTNEKKITVVENTDEYVMLDIEGVTSEEKVYISVMNGDKVVKSYKIGEINASNGRVGNLSEYWCWSPNISEKNENGGPITRKSAGIQTRNYQAIEDIDLGNTQNYYKIDYDGKHVEEVDGDSNQSIQSRVTHFEYKVYDKDSKFVDYLGELKLDVEDHFLGHNNGGNVTGKAKLEGRGIALYLNLPRYKNGLYYLTGVDNDSTTFKVKNGLGFQNQEGLTGSRKYSAINSQPDRQMGLYSDKFEYVNYFSKLEFQDDDYPAAGNNSCIRTYPNGLNGRTLTRARISKLTYRLDVSQTSNFIIGSTKIKADATLYKGNDTYYQDKITYNVDIKDSRSITNNIEKKVSVGQITYLDNWRENKKDYGLSMMYKDAGQQDKGGVFLINGSTQKYFSTVRIEGNSSQKWVSDWQTLSGSNNSEIQIRATQKNEEYMTLEVKVVKLDSTSNFTFELAQGRMDESKLKKLKSVKYELKLIKTNPLGDINIDVDQRLAQLSNGGKPWIHGSGKTGTLDNSSNYQELISSNGNIQQDKSISQGSEVGGKTQIRTDTNKKYEFFKIENQDEEVGIKYGGNTKSIPQDILVLPITRNELGTGDGKIISRNYGITVKDTTGTYNGGNLTLKYNTTPPIDGYIGSGSVDMSSAIVGVEYEFAPDQVGDIIGVIENKIKNSGIILTTKNNTKSPNGTGVLTSNNDKNIVNQIEFSAAGQTQNIDLNKIRAGERFTPQNITIGDFNGKFAIGFSTNGGIVIKKTAAANFGDVEKIIKIKYKYNGIILGTFDLGIKSTRTETDIGTVTINIDERFTQVANDYSWVRLNGDVSNLKNTSIGNYGDFIDVSGSFSGYDSGATINNIEKINDNTSISDVTPDSINVTYKKLQVSGQEKDEAAFPYKKNSKTPLTMEEFVKTDSDSLLMISKFDIKQQGYNGENKFTLLATINEVNRATEEVIYTGNVQEIYKTKSATSIFPILDPSKTAYAGTGSLNLARATIDKVYTFTAGATGDITSGSGAEQITLKIDSGKSLDATGIFGKNSTKNIANKVIITNGKERDVVRVNNRFETNVANDSVKIGINEQGQLFIQKLKEESIDSTITLEYYYSLDNNSTITSNKDIKLGSFTLGLKNEIVGSYDTNKMTVKIDKRFVDATSTPVWLLKDGKAIISIADEVNDNNKIDYTDLFKYEGSFISKESGSIVKTIGVEGRKVRRTTGKSYDIFTIDSNGWADEAAIPNKGEMSNLDNIVVVSKNNNNSVGLENKFSLVYGDSNNEKVYRGNLEEKIVGEGKTTGAGKIRIDDLEKGITYKFESGATGSGEGNSVVGKGESSPEKTVTITDVSKGEKLPDGKGASDITTDVIANKIVVTDNRGATTFISEENQNTTTVGDYTFGISSEGGLTIKKGESATSSENKTFTIKFYYSPQNAPQDSNGKYDVELSTFTLTFEKTNFEIEGEGVLDFGNLFYRESAPTETRIQEFKIKNPEMKNIDFKVESTSEMRLKDSGAAENDKIDLKDIGVKKMSNTSFELSATAVLTDTTKIGAYEGTIEVTVTISDSKK